jgi:hypothetical protein
MAASLIPVTATVPSSAVQERVEDHMRVTDWLKLISRHFETLSPSSMP